MSRLRGWDVVSYEDIHDIYQKRILELEADRDRLEKDRDDRMKSQFRLQDELDRLAEQLDEAVVLAAELAETIRGQVAALMQIEDESADSIARAIARAALAQTEASRLIEWLERHEQQLPPPRDPGHYVP